MFSHYDQTIKSDFLQIFWLLHSNICLQSERVWGEKLQSKFHNRRIAWFKVSQSREIMKRTKKQENGSGRQHRNQNQLERSAACTMLQDKTMNMRQQIWPLHLSNSPLHCRNKRVLDRGYTPVVHVQKQTHTFWPIRIIRVEVNCTSLIFPECLASYRL